LMAGATPQEERMAGQKCQIRSISPIKA